MIHDNGTELLTLHVLLDSCELRDDCATSVPRLMTSGLRQAWHEQDDR